MQESARTEADYVIYGTMPFAGPWNVEHNIAHALSDQHRVLYVDPPQSPATPFRYGLRAVRRSSVTALFDRRVRRVGPLSVFGPLALPPLTHRAAQQASLPMLRSQVRHAVRKSDLRDPVVIAWRSLHELQGAAGESLRVGVVMDYLPSAAALLGRDRADLEREMTQTCDAADVLCVTSRAMQELLSGRGWTGELLPFGFAGDLAPEYDSATDAPADYRSLPRPILGYTGSIDDRLDYELLVALADRFADGSLVFVGAVSPRLSARARQLLASRRNIHVLGVRPRQQLPAYIRHLDCALLPYAETEFTHYQSPMKLWDYLYSGVPIVGTGSYDLRHYPSPLVYFAPDRGQAPELVARALRAPLSGRERRRAFALQNTWEVRAAQLHEIVLSARRRRAGSAHAA